MKEFINKHRATILFAAACVALLLLYWLVFSGVSAEQIQRYVERYGKLAPVIYIAVFAVLPAFFFPVAVLALAGGLMFGLLWGSVYTFVGAIINCGVMFLLSRYAGRNSIRGYVERKLPEVWKARLAKASGREGFVLLVILRLIPAVPYNLINYSFGLTDMSFVTYMLGSAIGIVPGTLAFINIGDKALDVTSPSFWTAIGLLALLLLVTALLGKYLFPNKNKNGETKDGTGK